MILCLNRHAPVVLTLFTLLYLPKYSHNLSIYLYDNTRVQQKMVWKLESALVGSAEHNIMVREDSIIKIIS